MPPTSALRAIRSAGWVPTSFDSRASYWADAPKAAVGPYLRQGVPPPVIVDEMIETTFHAIVRKFGTVAKRRSS